MDKYKEIFGSEWYIKLRPFLESDKFREIGKELKKAGGDILPAFGDMFRAFKTCPYKDLKVVILTTNAFCDGEGDGLAFSASKTLPDGPRKGSTAFKVQKVLFDAVIEAIPESAVISCNPDLERWSKQGILLLNCDLSTLKGKTNVHLKIWEPFIEYLMVILANFNFGIVYCLVGKQAHRYENMIGKDNDIVKLEHPMLAIANNRPWKHNGMFEYINRVTNLIHNKKIKWNSPK